MMRFSVLKCITLNLIINSISCTAVGISSKLDLESLKSSSKSDESINNSKSTVVYKSTYKENGETKDEFEKIGVVCLSGEGCNTTQSVSPKSKESVETDVVVKVKTSVNVNDKNGFVDETPDIPVIVGSPDPNKNPNIVRPPASTVGEGRTYSGSPPSIWVPSVHYPQELQSSDVYRQKPNFITTDHIGIESPLFTNRARVASTDRYKTNTAQLYVPRFESSYHSHYYGEKPPPQVVHFPKTTTTYGYNPKNTVGEGFSTTYRNTATGAGVTCTCKNEVPTGLQWYPSRRVYNVDPGSQINDKLLDLN